jgi:hypothetical protein
MDNRRKLELYQLKDLYYYGSIPVTGHRRTTCVLLNGENGIVARGISMCSPRDQFNKRVGRAKALGNAMRAIEHKKDSLPVPIHATGGAIIPSSFNPEPNIFEAIKLKLVKVD